MTQLDILPKEWKIGKLGDYCSIFGGYAFKSEDYTDEGTPIVRIGNLQNGKVVLTKGQSRLPSKKLTNSLEKFLLNAGDILIALTGATTGKLAVVPKLFKGSLLNQRVGKFNVMDERLDKVFINFYAQTSFFQDEIKHNILQSAQGNISPKQIEKFSIPLPPLPEQKAIANVLQTILEAKEKTEEVIRATKELKKSMMKHLFTYGPVSPEEAERVRFKETEIGMIPEEWEVAKLGELSQIRYGLGQPSAFDENGVPMIRATNIKRGRIVKEGLIYVRRDAIPPSRNPFLKNGEVIVVRSGAYTGDVAMVTSDWEGAVAGYDLVVSPSEQILPLFCSQYLLSKGIQKYFRSQRDRSAQPHINSYQLANTSVSLPPFPIQQQIAEILCSIDAKIEAEENKKNALEGLFKTLLHDLMTAEIRVNNLPLEA